MKDRTKEILKDGFGSLVNNAAAIRGAKSGPLWLTIVMFVLAVFLPIIPLFVSNITTKGDSFLSSYSYGLERYVSKVATDLRSNGYEFGITEDHLLSVTKDNNPVAFEEYGAEKPFASYIDETTNEYNFLVYISADTKTSEKKVTYTKISNTYYATGSTTVTEYDKTKTDTLYRPSYIILFQDSVFVAVNKGVTSVKTSLGGDYKTMNANNAYLAMLLEVKNKEGQVITPDLTSTTYTDGVYKNFKKFLNKSYETLRTRNTFATCGIWLGIFFGINVIMGFLLWILTRGKNNPNNYSTPWLTMKIQGRLAFCPGLIALVAGFFLPSYLYIIYIATLGLRAMWVSMKELRPIQQ